MTNLSKKKQLASKTLKVGLGRIAFNSERLDEIKEAITKQDIKDLYQDKAIIIKPIRGRSKVKKRKNRRRDGKIKKKVKKKKQEYVKTTRKLRKYAGELRKQGKLDKEKSREIRKSIKTRKFKSKRQMKESLEGE